MFRWVGFFMSLGLCLALNDCAGGVVGVALTAAGRSAGTGTEYASWKATMPSIQPGTGRLFIYIGERASGVSAFAIGSGGTQFFGVDKDICAVLGSAFMYVDLSAGDHEVSANDMQMLFGRFRRGKYAIRIKIADRRATYLRFDAATEDAGEAPRVIDAATAEAEMAKLPLDTHFVTMECRKDGAQERGT